MNLITILIKIITFGFLFEMGKDLYNYIFKHK